MSDRALCLERHRRPKFERSLAGDQLNPVRTSFQCWCNFIDCFTDPLVHRVTRRINKVTGTPYDNGEDLQVVRYEPGQFYKRHHDQNTAIWAPQGPRVLVRAEASTPDQWFMHVAHACGSFGPGHARQTPSTHTRHSLRVRDSLTTHIELPEAAQT